MGGRQLDLALKKVTLRDYCYITLFYMLLFDSFITWFWCRCFKAKSSYFLYRVNFQGSIIGCCSRTLWVYYFLGESLKFLAFDEEMMISVSCSSCVEGNSYRNSFLPFLVAVVSFRVFQIGKASRLGSSLVQNFRLQSLMPLLDLPALTGSCSSKYPKKEVFSGEQCNLYDQAFLYECEDSWKSCGRLSLTEGVFRKGSYLLGKKSMGSLFLLILMRLRRVLGSLNL